MVGANVVSTRGDVDLAAVGRVFSDPARARMLLALADGRALAASMLALEAGVAYSTASHHLAKLADAGFVTVVSRGRHRYFALSGPQIAELIEAAARVAPHQRITSLRQGTRAHAIRYARCCYDHLAGRLGIAVTQALCERGFLAESQNSTNELRGPEVVDFTVTAAGSGALASFGVPALPGQTVRGCLDWTEQRHHIAGEVGRAMLDRMLGLEWVRRDPASRAVRLTDAGRSGLPDAFGVCLPAA
jgi:DNA-binding transcriptional ArsR family regulator